MINKSQAAKIIIKDVLSSSLMGGVLDERDKWKFPMNLIQSQAHVTWKNIVRFFNLHVAVTIIEIL